MPVRRALVLGASGGIGSALLSAIEADEKSGLSRSNGDFDLLNEDSIAACASRQTGPVDLIICTTGALEIAGQGPEKSVRSISAETMRTQFEINAIGPALLLKHFAPLLPRDAPSTFAVLSARVGSISDNHLGGWISYRSAKAALHQIVRTSAIELTRTHPQSVCVSIHPGTVRTPLTEKYVGSHPAVSPDASAANILNVLKGLSPEHSGRIFDWQGKEIFP